MGARREPGAGGAQLEGMPAALSFRLDTVGDEVVVSYGGRVVACYPVGDRGLRNLAIVALTRAGVPGVEVAGLFGVRAEHVSRLRRQAAEGGSAALVATMGRPVKLDEAARRRAHALSEQGRPGREIAAVLGVSEATISRLLSRRPRPEPAGLDLDPDAGAVAAAGSENAAGSTAETDAAETDAADSGAGGEVTADAGGAGAGVSIGDPAGLLGRLVETGRACAYAGAMLLYGYMGRAGAAAVVASLPAGAARRYDAAGLMAAAVFGFALGSSSAEGTKHLLAADAGALIGLERFPHLRTLRPRLAALADAVDPLELQVSLARAMLAADDTIADLFFVDDHFVAYTGAAPVAKGWNTRRRHAEPGRDDTLIVDDAWRAVCFATGAPSGLSKTMLGPLEQLRQIIGARPAMIGFDRGGSYPKLFAELTARGFDWVTYRRAPLAPVTATPTRSWVNIDGKRRYLSIADETVTLEGVGAVRQISVFEHGTLRLQILTSDLNTPAAALAWRLRCRWRIENCFKYLEDHHGIHWLCDYHMHLAADTTMVANPARAATRAALRTAEAAVSDIEQALAQAATTPTAEVAATNTTLATLTAQLEKARADVAAARAALKPIPAKLPANTLDPAATRATPRTGRRALQMVCRLLAYNAELDLARNLNTHLDDPDEYRTITRHLLHQPGTITYTPTAITVTIRSPDAPRITRALRALTNQLNTTPPHLIGDNRPITYQIAPTP